MTNTSFVEMFSTGACPNSDATLCFLTFAAYNGTADASKIPLSTNFELLTPFYDVTTMVAPNLQVTAVVPSDNSTALPMAWEQPFDVTVTGLAATAFAWLETGLFGRWSDNGVLLPKVLTGCGPCWEFWVMGFTERDILLHILIAQCPFLQSQPPIWFCAVCTGRPCMSFTPMPVCTFSRTILCVQFGVHFGVGFSMR